MRLIGQFSEVQQAELFSSFLSKQQIKNSCQKVLESGKYLSYQLWVDQEEDVEAALSHFEEYVQDPLSKKFIVEKIQVTSKPKSLHRFLSFTSFIIFLCSLFFVWNDREEAVIEKSNGAFAAEVLWTPLFKAFLFDDPFSINELQSLVLRHKISLKEGLESNDPSVQREIEDAFSLPSFGGFLNLFLEKIKVGSVNYSAPLFEKISQGEIWRLFTPCLLHRDFWHLFFNMSWLWALGMQIESRLRIPRTILLILVLGVFSNLVQYLMSGPFFLGFSGVVVGLATFIWSRQKKAPWEGYPMQKAMRYFLFFGVIAMFFLGAVSFILQLVSVEISSNIANAAHVSGGLAGYLLGRSQFFAKRFT